MPPDASGLMRKNQRKGRTVLFWTTFSAYEPVLHAEVELILREKAQGSHVIGVHCDGLLPRCHAMRQTYKDHLTCVACQTAWKGFITPLLDVVVKLDGPIERYKGPIPVTQEDLRAYIVDGSDLGRAVLSTIKTDAGDDDPILASRAEDIGLRLSAAETVKKRLDELLDRYRPDMVYMFNGRQFDSRPLLRLCEQLNIPFRTYEKGAAPNSFTFRENSTVHNVGQAQARFEAFLSEPISKYAADLHIAAIREGQDVYGRGFRSGQILQALPKSFKENDINIVILHSSEDEYADVDHSLRLWIGRNFTDFLDILLHRLGEATSVRVYVRLHPRLARYQANSVRRLLARCHPLLEVIPPESSVDTFALACASTLTICYGSTAGPESVVMGARVVCVGECTYSRSGIMPDVFRIEELLDFAYAPEKIKCSPKKALMYLEFLRTSGESFALVDSADYRLSNLFGIRVLSSLKNFFFRFRVPVLRFGTARIVLAIFRSSFAQKWLFCSSYRLP